MEDDVPDETRKSLFHAEHDANARAVGANQEALDGPIRCAVSEFASWASLRFRATSSSQDGCAEMCRVGSPN